MAVFSKHLEKIEQRGPVTMLANVRAQSYLQIYSIPCLFFSFEFAWKHSEWRGKNWQSHSQSREKI